MFGVKQDLGLKTISFTLRVLIVAVHPANLPPTRAEKSTEAFREQKFNGMCVPEVSDQLRHLFSHFGEVICPFIMDCLSSGRVKKYGR